MVSAFSASFSFCVIQVSVVDVLDIFWYSRVILTYSSHSSSKIIFTRDVNKKATDFSWEER
jgi:hypothetical protein